MLRIEQLQFFNPHWDAEVLNLPRKSDRKRKLFWRIRPRLLDRFIVAIHGVRRTGKSYLSEQLAAEFVALAALDRSLNYLRFVFEHEDQLDLLPAQYLEEVLELYFGNILKSHPAKVTRRTLIMLDEVQNVEGWQSVVKRYYDLNPNLKFIVTGSSSLFLSEGSESLAGRISEYALPCLDFEEYCWFAGDSAEVDTSAVSHFDVRENFFSHLERSPISINAGHLERFERFILAGGFPESALMLGQGRTIEEAQHYIREQVVSKVIGRDLKKYFRVKNTTIDRRLFDICCNDVGSYLEVANLARELGISQITTAKHLEIFAQTKLLAFLSKFDRKLRRVMRGSRKVYVASPSIVCSMLYQSNTQDSALIGHIVENYVFNQLESPSAKIYVYYPKNGREIDFYCPNEKWLIECKYTQRIDPRDFGYLRDQAKLLGCKFAVISKQSWSERAFTMIPAMYT